MMKDKDAVILFHIPIELKASLIAESKNRKISMTKLINRFIVESLAKKIVTTGRGNADIDAIEKTKEYLRMKHPQCIRPNELAKYINKPQARALRILDLLSGVSNDRDKEGAEFLSRDFLVYVNDDISPTTYGIFKDVERGIYAL